MYAIGRPIIMGKIAHWKHPKHLYIKCLQNIKVSQPII